MVHIREVRHSPSQISFKFGTVAWSHWVKKITKFQLAIIYRSQVTSIWNLVQNDLFTLVTQDIEVNSHVTMTDNLTYRCVNIIKIGTGKFWMLRNSKIKLKIPKSKPKCLNFDVQVKNIKIFALNLDPQCIQNNFCCLTWFSFKLCENRVLGCGYYMCKKELGISCRYKVMALDCMKTFAGEIIATVDILCTLTLSASSISESCIKIKINLNYYFRTSLWCLKRFYEGL